MKINKYVFLGMISLVLGNLWVFITQSIGIFYGAANSTPQMIQLITLSFMYIGFTGFGFVVLFFLSRKIFLKLKKK